MELLERETFLESLAGYADEALLGQGRAVLIAGEAGVGKTALLEAFHERFPGARWAWGGCDDLSTPRPLAPLHDVARALGGDLLAAVRRGAVREELFEELLTALGAGDELTVVVIEDLHWADEATLDLVKHVVRRMTTSRALLLLTYRDEGLDEGSRLRRLLGDIGSYRSTRRISLPALSEQAVRGAADGTAFDGADLYRLTHGNPYYLSEVLAAQAGEVPPSIRDAVLARAARLDPEGRRVLDVAAVVGMRQPVALLRVVEGVTDAGLDDCVRSGLLVESDGDLAFRHDLARLAVSEALPPQRRIGLHAAVLQALGDDADDARLAHHADGAGDSERVLRHAPAAAVAASRAGAHIEAAQQYRRALRHAAGLPARDRAELLEALADETSLTDELADLTQAREDALALWRELGDDLRIGDGMRKLINPLWRMARGAEAEAMAEQAVTYLERLPPGPELARALHSLSAMRHGQGEVPEALRLCLEAQQRARELGLDDLLVDTLNNESCFRTVLGGDGMPMLREALDLALATGLDQQIARTYTNLHECLHLYWEIEEAERLYAEAMSYFDVHDIVAFEACLRGDRIASIARQGRTAEARALNDEMLGSRLPSPINALAPLTTAGLLHARSGALEDAWRALDDVLDLAQRLGESTYLMRVNLARAEAHWLERRPLAAADEARASATCLTGPDGWEVGQVLTWCRRTGVTFDAPAAWPEPRGPWALELAGDHRAAAGEWDRLGGRQLAAMALAFSSDEADVRDAVERFAAMDAPASEARARQRLREVGAETVPSGPRASTRSHPAGLTKRESEVLEALTRGASNAEIAAELYLSERTVEHHVSNVLGKLGVGTRVEAAQAAKEGGFAESLSR